MAEVDYCAVLADLEQRRADIEATIAVLRPLVPSSAAAILGRRGGKKGGVARARKLSPERRTEIAKQAARARWARKRTGARRLLYTRRG